MFKKLKTIKNFAVYPDFDWDSAIRDTGNNIGEFKKLNILYGRNYSGKTSLSRIFRSFEVGAVHIKYPNSKYELVGKGNNFLDETCVRNHEYEIRVYNKDFVNENLKWLTDEEGSIKPFTIIGGQNVETENKISKNKEILGSEELEKGLKYIYIQKNKQFADKVSYRSQAETSLEVKLRNKANLEIKTNPIYRNVNYRINNIKNDIQLIQNSPPQLLSEKEIQEKKYLLNEAPLSSIPLLPIYIPDFDIIVEYSNQLLGKEIKPTESIQDLINNSLLQEWVRSGIGLHKEKLGKCGFCGQILPDDLWVKLDAHFSKESEELREDIIQQIQKIEEIKKEVKEWFTLNKEHFYKVFEEKFLGQRAEWKRELKNFLAILDLIKAELENRKNDIFNCKPQLEVTDISTSLVSRQKFINDLIVKNNEKTNSLTEEQQKAVETLRLDEVAKFLNTIDYSKELTNINQLKTEEENLRAETEGVKANIKKLEDEIQAWEIELKDERLAADKVNEYLNHFFGHEGLTLVAEEQDSVSNFVIKRGEKEAYNLIEGECSLISFCYFMAKLEDGVSKNKDVIIWIDDPISSLDSNHIFFIYSLIESKIAKPYKKEDGSNTYNYCQLFISTHNLDFLKYLKRLSKPKKDFEYFLLERGKESTVISLMPNYLRNYITEFNYLFHQIYKCREIGEATGHDCFYNFGNNLRKFLEAYLFYKYPVNKDITEKLRLFFGDDDTSVELTNRLDNELSHLEEIFDRSMKPIEIPEIPKLANYVLNQIRIKDTEQYNALIESIGAKLEEVVKY